MSPYRGVCVLHKDKLLLVTHSVHPNDSATEAKQLPNLHAANSKIHILLACALLGIKVLSCNALLSSGHYSKAQSGSNTDLLITNRWVEIADDQSAVQSALFLGEHYTGLMCLRPLQNKSHAP